MNSRLWSCGHENCLRISPLRPPRLRGEASAASGSLPANGEGEGGVWVSA